MFQERRAMGMRRTIAVPGRPSAGGNRTQKTRRLPGRPLAGKTAAAPGTRSDPRSLGPDGLPVLSRLPPAEPPRHATSRTTILARSALFENCPSWGGQRSPSALPKIVGRTRVNLHGDEDGEQLGTLSPGSLRTASLISSKVRHPRTLARKC